MLKHKNASTTRDTLFKYAFLATIIWVIGLVFSIIGGSMASEKPFHGVGVVIQWAGTIALVFSWIIILIFGIFTIITSLDFKEQEKILGIICGTLCIVIPLAGIIMAWILYYKQ